MEEKDMKTPTGFAGQGGSPDGQTVFFGFHLGESEQVFFKLHHANLADIIRRLTTIAYDAAQLRLKANPAAEFREGEYKPDSTLSQFYFDVDLTGQVARLVGRNKDGLPVEVQFPYDLVKGLGEAVPVILSDMRQRQGAHKRQN